VGEEKFIQRDFMGWPRGIRLLGRTRRIWAHYIKKHVKGIGLGGVKWIQVALEREERWAVVDNWVSKSTEIR
jgi:hypothetical protein